MNSIDQNQPEETHADLTSTEAIAKIKEIASGAHSCFFCTNTPLDDSTGARPMGVLKVDERGSLWFMTTNGGHLYRELTADPTVKLYFQGSMHTDFMQLNGRAFLSADKAKIEELWNPIIKTWFTEGKDDPRIAVIEVKPEHGYYWDTKHGYLVAAVKMMIGAATGTTMDDSIQGKINV